MKKFLSALLVLAMILATFSVAFAYKEKSLVDEDGYGTVVYFKGTAYGYEKVTNNSGKSKTNVALRKGSLAVAVAEKGDWYKILIPRNGKADDQYWFNKKYVRVAKTADFAKGTAYVFSSGGSGRSSVLDKYDKYSKGTVTGYKKVTVKSGRRTNVRSTPSLAGKSLGVVGKNHSTKTLKLHKDRVWKRDNRGVKFYHVMYKGKPAWISEQYVTLKK